MLSALLPWVRPGFCCLGPSLVLDQLLGPHWAVGGDHVTKSPTAIFSHHPHWCTQLWRVIRKLLKVASASSARQLVHNRGREPGLNLPSACQTLDQSCFGPEDVSPGSSWTNKHAITTGKLFGIYLKNLIWFWSGSWCVAHKSKSGICRLKIKVQRFHLSIFFWPHKILKPVNYNHSKTKKERHVIDTYVTLWNVWRSLPEGFSEREQAAAWLFIGVTL